MSDADDTVQAAIDRACVNLEGTVKDFGLNLTFEAVDIPALEEVLLAVREMNDEPALTGACFMVGAYLGEILRKKVGGKWGMSADGVAELQLTGSRGKIFPVEKVRKFARDPEADSLVFYVQALLASS